MYLFYLQWHNDVTTIRNLSLGILWQFRTDGLLPQYYTPYDAELLRVTDIRLLIDIIMWMSYAYFDRQFCP